MEEAVTAAEMDLSVGVALAWDAPILPRRCTSEACDEYDGVHCYGDGCAMVSTTGPGTA